jgi:hypothetical protein
MNEAAPDAYTLLQEHPALNTSIQHFHRELRKLWDTEGLGDQVKSGHT